jgi:hypothetical protein
VILIFILNNFNKFLFKKNIELKDTIEYSGGKIRDFFRMGSDQ